MGRRMNTRRILALLLIFTFGGVFLLIWKINLNHWEILVAPIQNWTSLGVYNTNVLPSNDYNTLINITDFNFTILNEPCYKNSTLSLLVLVHSAPLNQIERENIRNTWGQKVPDMELLFLLGAATSLETQTEVDKENQKHNDIIQGRFIDEYRNLTYKHVMALKYAIYHCPQAKYILKTDDDIFVNMPTVIEYVKTQLIPVKAKNFLFCPIHINQEILRPESKRKWAVTIEEYPGTEYPTYCGGWGIIYSPDALFTLYRKAQKAPYFWIDDVHITGTMANGTNITQVSFRPLILGEDRMKEIISTTKTNKQKPKDYFLFGPIQMVRANIKDLWNILWSR